MRVTRRKFVTFSMLLAGAGCRRPTNIPSQSETASVTTPKSDDQDIPTLAAEGATLDLPLLNELHRADAYIRDHFDIPYYFDAGIGSVGLKLATRLTTGGYWCSPTNALTFASTGGDGNHYSLLVRNGVIDNESPVVLTWPSEGEHVIVGESLYDFLCFGLHGGYFEILSYDESEVPSEDVEDLWFFSHVEEPQRKVLTYLAKELDLKPSPWKEREKTVSISA